MNLTWIMLRKHVGRALRASREAQWEYAAASGGETRSAEAKGDRGIPISPFVPSGLPCNPLKRPLSGAPPPGVGPSPGVDLVSFALYPKVNDIEIGIPPGPSGARFPAGGRGILRFVSKIQF